MYNIIAINKAEEIPMPTPEAGIVIANEPVIMPEEEVVALEEEVVAPEEEVIGVIEEVTGVVVEVTGVIEEMTGVDFIVGDKEYFSGMIQDLSGETLYNISGDVVGEIYVESGEMVPVDLSGVSLLPTPLSVVYPTQSIRLDQSGYITFNTLESVTTTGGEAGANYCSRIAYENLSSILKAGTWTWRETNDYLLQGDAEDLVVQGLADHTLLEVNSEEFKNIFSGDNGTGYGLVYDVYISFMDFETRVYHRITIVYADDPVASDGAGGQRYVLDPLRGARTVHPQIFSNYFAYYDDEIDVKYYIGQAYSPSVIKEQSMTDEEIAKVFSDAGIIASRIDIGEILTGVSEEQSAMDTGALFTGEVITGEVIVTGETIVPEVINTGTVVPELIPEVIEEGQLPFTGGTITEEETTGAIVMGDEISEAYFDRAYDKGEYDDKIIELQKMLTWLQIYDGALDGVYSDAIIESVYQYQLAKNILTQDDSVGVRGYLGPKTRLELNQSYIEYQQYENALTQQATEQITSTGTILSNEYISTETGINEILIPMSGQETLNEIGTISGLNIFDMFDPFFDVPTFSGLNIRLFECENEDVMCKKKITEKLLKEKGYVLSDRGLVQLSQDALIGSETLDMEVLEGELVTQVVLQSSNELSGKIAEVQIPEDTIVVIENGDIFTGEIFAPTFLDTEIIRDQLVYDVIAAVDVGTDEKIQFKNEDGDAMFVTFRIPAPGMQEGDTLDIYYSQDGETQQYLTDIEVQLIDGEPYAIFEADHFTQFYLGNTTGTFVINNDTAYTTGLAVTLNSNVTGATHMRFGNTIAERDLAGWVSYATGYAWNLTGLYSGEVKRVYAQFSGNGVVRNVSDSIVYDINSGVNTSGLQLHINASTGGTRFYDIGSRNLFFTGMAGAYKTTRSGEEIISLNGTSQYIENTSGFITTYPFTISARVKPNVVNTTQTIAMFGNSTTNTTFYGIRLVNANAVAVGRTTTARSATNTTTLVAGRRYHIIGVFNSATSRTIYVDNANPVTNAQTAKFATTNPRRRIGRHPGLSTTNYFNGNIDEVRVYNKALTAEERQSIFMVPPTFDTQTAFTGTPTLYGSLGDKMLLPTLVISGITYSTTGDGTGRWKTLPMITGLANGAYNVTLNYTSVYGKTGTTIYTGGLTISTTGITVTYTPSLATTGNVVATLTGLDPTYMIVNNSGSELYTFTGNGSFTWQYVDKQGTTGSTTATVDRIKNTVLAYSTGIFYENSSLNNGSIGSSITVVLSSGSFSGVATNYITLSNVPTGLTGVFTLSGTNKIIITLSGTATNHAAANSTSGLVISFLTGAFVDKNPSEVINSTQTGIAVQFYDYTVGEQFRVNGTSVGTRFYDVGPYNTLFTGYGNAATETWSGESVMRVDGIGDYIENSKSVITDYPFTMSVRAKRSRTATTEGIFTFGKNPEATYNDRRGIAFQNSGYPAVIAKGTDGTEQITTAASITPIGERVHIAVVFNSATNRQLYVNGVLVATGTTSPGSLSTGAAQNRRIGAWAGQTTHNFLSGRVDEARLFNTSLDATQVESLYMQKPSYVAPKILYNSTGTLTGLVNDPKMYSVTLTISGTTYTGTIQSGVRSNTVGPLAAGTYDVQLKYMNIYGKTGSIYYTGGLIVSAPSISYSSLTFYENSGTNNGSITGNITATLTGGAFSSTVVSSGYVTISNVPAGLTGVFTLSGTNKVIIALSGNATNHTSADTTSGLIISFLTGAFSGMNPSDVVNATQTGVAIQFYDDKYYIGGGQLRLDGSLSGAGFDDLTDMHITTGAGGISNSIWTGEIATETVIGSFNGSSKYVSIGNYTLSNYTIATWIKTDDLDSYHPIITNGSEEFIYLYTDNKITLPSHGSLKSTTTLGLGTRYHVALVQSGGLVSLYVDGKEQASGTTTFSLNNLALYLGYNPNYTEYRQGLMDEVRIYSGSITSGQVYSLYMKDPSFTPRSTITSTPDLRGLAPDPKMTIGLTIDGKNYPATNNQDGTRSALHIGPLASGVYDVQVNYMNVYGKTGVLYYTGGLTVNPLIYIEYAPETQTSGNVVATVTGYQSITGAHVTNNGGSPNYTFTSNGSFTFELANASGDTISITAIVDWIQKAGITYSTDSFYENTGLNNGSIANAMVATLTNDTFSSDIITNGLIQMTNIPAGLTGKYTLSGNTQLIIELTGNAINHNSDDGVYDITLSFLTGAFSTYTPGEVGGSTKTDIHLHFYDALIGSGTLRLDGSYSGTNYYDLSNTNITTGTAVITGLSQSGETIMGFNGSTSYIDIGTYTLPEYSMSAWIYRSNMSTSYQSIIARNGVGTSFEISTYNNLINLYSNGGLQSTVTIQSGQRYHIAVVKDTVGTKLYVNGELNNSNTFTGGLSATALAVGRWNTSQYRSGNIDEVHIYDDTLSATQVKNLYLLEPSYAPTTIYTDTTTLTGLVNDPKMYSVNVTISGTIYTGSIQSGIRSNAVGPLATGIYDVQINYMNVYGKTGTLYFTGGLIVTTESTGSLTISGPVSFNFDNRNASMQAFSIEKTFSGTNDYFQVLDTLGSDTGYYTTISISNMTNGEGDIISSSAMAVKSLTGIVTLLGTDNPRIYSAITGAYQYFSGPPLTFIARDTAANGGVKGTYGLHTIRKIDIPALQDPGNYTGVITYTLY